MLKATIKDCAGKEGASDADVQDIFDRKPPSSKGGKCTIGKYTTLYFFHVIFTEMCNFLKSLF